MKIRTKKTRPPHPSPRAPRPSRQRKGVLLIVVLSLLVLFALIGFTFIMVAGQYSRAASANRRVGLFDDQGEELVEQAFLELARGSDNLHSRINDVDDLTNPTVILRSQCLLEDIYGQPIMGDVASTGSFSNDFWRFNATASPGWTFDRNWNIYNGQVMTFLSGKANSLSGRIVLTRPITSNRIRFYVRAVNHRGAASEQQLSGDRMIINGRPFSGDGTTTANESWDAPDEFNPFLAYIPANATTTADIIPSFADRLLDLDANTATVDLAIDNDRDGILDSGWLDLGQPVKTASDGRRYKPFFAILCVDLDGRLNLNAHGNLAQLASVNPNYVASHSGPLAGNATPTGPRGLGTGPAGVNLSGLFAGDETKYEALLDARYSSPGEATPGPGRGAVDDLWLLMCQPLPNAYSAAASGGYGSHPDTLDGGLIGVDHAGRPSVFNMGLTNEVNSSPYQLNLVAPNGKDTPFTAGELERLLRWFDSDRDSLPRIWERDGDLAEADFQSPTLRRSVTTNSSHVPVSASPADVITMMGNRLVAGNATDFPTVDDSATTNEVRNLVPIEIHLGERMNVNRLWGNNADGNGNNVIDEPAELSAETLMTNVSAYVGGVTGNYVNSLPGMTDKSMGRYLYARQLYVLMMLTSDPAYKIPASAESLTDPQRRELAIRRIAQWAINCVDFRDPDAIMTPFEYDVNPFNGWDVDGDLATDDEGDPVDGTPHADRRVVWGMEYPDLMFTESLSTHDRGVRDTAFDDFTDLTDEDADVATATPLYGSKRIHTGYPGDNNKKGDKDLDQTRIPEGSTFLEFYCPRNLVANNPVLPRELYVDDAGTLKLKLDKVVGNSPVWRVAISKPHHSAGDGAARNALSPLVRRTTNPDTVNFDPAELSVAADNPIERYLWFNSAPPTVATTSGEMIANTFYVDDPQTALLAPGRYCVVGPRDKTYLGGKPISDDATATAETTKGDQLIDLNAGALNMDYKDLTGVSAYPLSPAVAANINPPLALNAVIDSPGYPHKRGLNISEPLPTATNKYPVPTHDNDGDGITDAYGDSGVVPPTAASLYPDTPFDSEATPDRPLHAGAILQQQTVENYRTAYLQRLANPLVAWNPPPPDANYVAGQPVNPYITVDWIPLDLNVFNGEDREADDWDTRPGANATLGGDFDTDDDGTGTLTFAARQRRNPGAPTTTNTFWTPGGQLGTGLAEDTAAGVTECFRYPLGAANDPMMTLGYVNLPYTPLGGSTVGDPDSPFPWLMWPNRPFVSQYELMLVPASSQSRVLSEFTRAQTTVSPYLNTNPSGFFGHLLNFYHQSATAGEAAHFYRVLQYLQVPSNFAGSQAWLQPGGGDSSLDMYSPFHRQSKFRDPGMVNINTIPDQVVWEAIDNNANAGTGFTSWSAVDASRRGTLDAFGRFGNSFRGDVISSDGSTVTSSDVNRGLLRANTGQPLFGPPASAASHNNATHNAYFRMQALQRLGNTITTRSNVFAIWITVGYYEVDAAGTPLRELGSDTGEITRHRGFYVIDRSIPVGYQRGRNHNVENCVLIKRYIE